MLLVWFTEYAETDPETSAAPPVPAKKQEEEKAPASDAHAAHKHARKNHDVGWNVEGFFRHHLSV